jgi:hypothetical protein
LSSATRAPTGRPVDLRCDTMQTPERTVPPRLPTGVSLECNRGSRVGPSAEQSISGRTGDGIRPFPIAIEPRPARHLHAASRRIGRCSIARVQPIVPIESKGLPASVCAWNSAVSRGRGHHQCRAQRRQGRNRQPRSPRGSGRAWVLHFSCPESQRQRG